MTSVPRGGSAPSSTPPFNVPPQTSLPQNISPRQQQQQQQQQPSAPSGTPDVGTLPVSKASSIPAHVRGPLLLANGRSNSPARPSPGSINWDAVNRGAGRREAPPSPEPRSSGSSDDSSSSSSVSTPSVVSAARPQPISPQPTRPSASVVTSPVTGTAAAASGTNSRPTPPTDSRTKLPSSLLAAAGALPPLSFPPPPPPVSSFTSPGAASTVNTSTASSAAVPSRAAQLFKPEAVRLAGSKPPATPPPVPTSNSTSPTVPPRSAVQSAAAPQRPTPSSTNIVSRAGPGTVNAPASAGLSLSGTSRRKTVQFVDPGIEFAATHFYQKRLCDAKAAADVELAQYISQVRSWMEFSKSDVLKHLTQFSSKFVATNVKDVSAADCRRYVNELVNLLRAGKRSGSRISAPVNSAVSGSMRTLTTTEEYATAQLLRIISQFSRIATAGEEGSTDIVDYLSQQAVLAAASTEQQQQQQQQQQLLQQQQQPVTTTGPPSHNINTSAGSSPSSAQQQQLQHRPPVPVPTFVCRICERSIPQTELQEHTEDCKKLNTAEPRLRYINDQLQARLNALQSAFAQAVSAAGSSGQSIVAEQSQSPQHGYATRQKLLNIWFMDDTFPDDKPYSRLIRCNCADRLSEIVQKIFAAPIHRRGAFGGAVGSPSIAPHLLLWGIYVPRLAVFLDDALPLGAYELADKEEVHFKRKPRRPANEAQQRRRSMLPMTMNGVVGVAHTGMSDAQFLELLTKTLTDALAIQPRDRNGVDELARLARHLLSIRTQNTLYKSKFTQIDTELRDLLKKKMEVLGELAALRRDRRKSLFDRPAANSRVSIADFDFVKPISKGAYGQVFLAKRKKTGDMYAIKAIRKQEVMSKNQANHIAVERNILAFAQNDFVVRLYYTFQSKNYLFMVMEYLPGGDVFSLLRNLNCFSEDMARKYIAELVIALEYLHVKGIVHRDLKPDNMLISRSGHIKLTDFGLSAMGLLEKQEEFKAFFEPTPEVEEEGRAIGSPEYLAPEVMLGTGSNQMVDWWAVGVILYEFLVGITPFYGDTVENVFENILAAEIHWPEPPDPVPSDEAKDLISRLLIVSPADRLGANGVDEIKAHPFFRGVSWQHILAQPGPYVPKFEPGTESTSTEYFDARNEVWNVDDCSLDLEAEVEDSSNSDAANARRMRGYSFVNFAHLASSNKELTSAYGPYSRDELDVLCRLVLREPANESRANEYRQTRSPHALRHLVEAVAAVAQSRASVQDIGANIERILTAKQ